MKHTELFLHACKLMRKEGLFVVRNVGRQSVDKALKQAEGSKQDQGVVFVMKGTQSGKVSIQYCKSDSPKARLDGREVGQIIQQCLNRATIPCEWSGNSMQAIMVPMEHVHQPK